MTIIGGFYHCKPLKCHEQELSFRVNTFLNSQNKVVTTTTFEEPILLYASTPFKNSFGFPFWQILFQVQVITDAKLHRTKSELRFCTGSSPGEKLWQELQLKKWLINSILLVSCYIKAIPSSLWKYSNLSPSSHFLYKRQNPN